MVAGIWPIGKVSASALGKEKIQFSIIYSCDALKIFWEGAAGIFLGGGDPAK